MSRKQAKPRLEPPRSAAAPAATSGKKWLTRNQATTTTPGSPRPVEVSPRWLLGAILGTLALSAFCAWASLCLLFWQGSWQLLYHPSSTVTRTPATVGLQFDAIGFATTDTGLPRLSGWWIPASAGAQLSGYTVLALHGQTGNLGDSVDHLAQIHAAGVNLFAIDYRGYGRSQFTHPSEKRWLEDAGWALQYLTMTRDIAPAAIVLEGSGLGADLALELAASHPELAGVIVEAPLEDPTRALFDDPRARLVPARLLVRDRFNLPAAAARLRIPCLWLLPSPNPARSSKPVEVPEAYQKIATRKMVVWLAFDEKARADFAQALSRWLDELRTSR
jgi:uncharacterized protein